MWRREKKFKTPYYNSRVDRNNWVFCRERRLGREIGEMGEERDAWVNHTDTRTLRMSTIFNWRGISLLRTTIHTRNSYLICCLGIRVCFWFKSCFLYYLSFHFTFRLHFGQRDHMRDGIFLSSLCFQRILCT